MAPNPPTPVNRNQYDGQPSPLGSLDSGALEQEEALVDDEDDVQEHGYEGGFMARRRYETVIVVLSIMN